MTWPSYSWERHALVVRVKRHGHLVRYSVPLLEDGVRSPPQRSLDVLVGLINQLQKCRGPITVFDEPVRQQA